MTRVLGVVAVVALGACSGGAADSSSSSSSSSSSGAMGGSSGVAGGSSGAAVSSSSSLLPPSSGVAGSSSVAGGSSASMTVGSSAGGGGSSSGGGQSGSNVPSSSTGAGSSGAPLTNGASFQSQVVPPSVLPGASFQATVTMVNTGTTTWSLANGQHLGSENPRDNSTWGTNRGFMDAAASVAPGGSYTFMLNLTAPVTPGTYAFQWQMLQEAVEWFGAPSTSVDVTVAPPSTRNISIGEAVNIIEAVHDGEGANLGSASTREQRNAFFESAVAVIHFGHPTYNPNGADPGWCIKDGGGGRPQSDDVIVRCDTRDAWDVIPGAGSDTYYFEAHAIGILPAEQNVYPPRQSALP